MNSKIQQLTETIYNEGIQKANEDAEAILKEAREKATGIESEAMEKAKRLRKNLSTGEKRYYKISYHVVKVK